MKTEIRPLRLLVKAICLFLVVNIAFAMIDPALDKVTAYNSIFPGRVRFPFGEDAGTYSVMVDNLDIMTASHEISVPKRTDEFRVAIIGDSSVWGEGAPAKESIAVLWNEFGYSCGDRKIRVYNLAYPHPSMVKDLIIIDKSLEYEPDMIVWFMTLNTLTPRRLSPFVRANASRAVEVLDRYHISYDVNDVSASGPIDAFYEKTLMGRRSEIARLIKLQALGLMWTLTGLDSALSPMQLGDLPNDVAKDTRYKVYQSEADLYDGMMLDAIAAGHDLAGSIPILVVNEPMFIATGMNSKVRYNDGYPRWAYDYYRDTMFAESQRNGWNYLDLWDSIPRQYFFDTVLHISPDGQRLMIPKINSAVQSIACP